jgi:glycosyltransferase involved in cell wall biosynthesis
MLALEQPDSALAAAEQFLRDFGPDDGVMAIGRGLRDSRGYYRRAALPGKGVSLCMIVRNEERCIARCLASCKSVVHEMVVVDTGSDDRTRQIAELFGARVIEQPWNGDFSAARNAGLAVATAEWLLVMDADEVLSSRDHELFRQALDRAENPAAFEMTTRNYTNHATLDGFIPCNGEYPEDESGSGWTPSKKVRLFPNGMNIRFQGVVHELVEPSIAQAGIRVVPHPVVVHHFGGLEDSRMQRKREIYYTLGLKKLNSCTGSDQKALYELAIQAAELARFDEAEALWRRFIENETGYAPAWCNFSYVLLRRGLLEEAWNATERALQLQPDYHAAHVNRALCAFCSGPGEEVSGTIRSELDMFPTDITLRVLLELCRIDGRETEAGISGLRQIVAQGYQIGNFIKTTAEVLNLVGRRDEANLVYRVLAEIVT